MPMTDITENKDSLSHGTDIVLCRRQSMSLARVVVCGALLHHLLPVTACTIFRRCHIARPRASVLDPHVDPQIDGADEPLASRPNVTYATPGTSSRAMSSSPYSSSSFWN